MRALETLADKPADAPEAAQLADPFMFQDYYSDRLQEQVANVFGAQFAKALLQLEPGAWQGPVESGLGWHLVWVESLTPARVPAFEEVEPGGEVRMGLRSARRIQAPGVRSDEGAL